MSETDVVGMRLAQARDHVASAARTLDLDTSAIGELHAGVDGAMQVCTALADLITTLAGKAPLLLAQTHQKTLDELQADLRAMHGCLTTGRRLLDPARADLHHLATTHHHAERSATPNPAAQTAAALAEQLARVEVPEGDGADQQHPAWPGTEEETPGETKLDAIAEAATLEADPADVADQHRQAPVLAETDAAVPARRLRPAPGQNPLGP